MEKRDFGNTGLRVSALGFGAAPVGYLKTDQQQVARMLNLMLDQGLSLIDTAECYAGSEEMIRQAVGHRRDEYVLVTKTGHDVPDTSGPEFSEERITGSIDRSLRRLGTDRLDVVLLHSCSREKLEQGEAVAALVKAREAGKIRFAGYSGDNEAAVYAATLEDIAVIETSVSIADQANIEGVLPVARRRGLGVEAKRPIANAAWKSGDQQPGFYKNYASEYHQRLAKMGLTTADLGFDGPENKVWPEIALRFTLSMPGVHCAIVGTTKTDNALANIAAAKKGPLPQPTVQAIRAAFARAQPAAGWPGQG
ncbi:MAG: aldo/keto reductase [Phycisphaeraceae bacterium]